MEKETKTPALKVLGNGRSTDDAVEMTSQWTSSFNAPEACGVLLLYNFDVLSTCSWIVHEAAANICVLRHRTYQLLHFMPICGPARDYIKCANAKLLDPPTDILQQWYYTARVRE